MTTIPAKPTDADVVDAVGASASPTAVLAALMGAGHDRATSQRAMQGALGRHLISFDADLRFVPGEFRFPHATAATPTPASTTEERP